MASGKAGGKLETRNFVERTYPRNLERTEVYEEGKQNDALAKASGSLKDPPAAEASPLTQGYKWLSDHLLVSDPQGEVRVEKHWDKYVADQDDLVRVWALKGKVAMGLWTLYENLPKFTPKDLVVCHRQNDKGAWKTEVWAHRDFQAGELLIGAMSTDLRDRMWTYNVAVLIGLPQQGPCRHPEGKNLALDGRNRQVLAASKTIDEAEHRGGIFWAIPRTGDKGGHHNMVLETIQWDASMNLKLPGGKKRKVEMASKDLPQLPVMTNPKKISAHTPLLLYQDLQTLQKLSKGE